MEKIVKFPWNFPLYGMLLGFIMLIVMVFVPSMTLLVTSLIILHVSGLILAAKFILCITGFYSSVLGK
ncbi:MAG: hypothetical protein HY951_02105 [Bacteroidia bacterium]|nr:hypothetical protein [Bacteroidia bacterium]